jgi:CRISPR-associated endonuclease Csn1
LGYVLGLDLGPTSIGWAAVKTDEKGRFESFFLIKDGAQTYPAIGARIFPAGVEKLNQGKNEQSKNKKRREKRSTRRRLRRARARRLELINLLSAHGLIKETVIETLQQKDPYELRVKALSDKVELEDLARIFLHFAKRRGFKSNRKQPEEKDAKASDMKKARDRLNVELNGKTPGQFWHEKLKNNPLQAIRNRRNNYQWIAQRHHYQDELARIWKMQSTYYPDVFTHSFYQKLEKLLFDQIHFELSNTKKRKIIGTCSLIPGKIRCGYSDRIAQKFRMLQKINDILIQDSGKERSLFDEEREKLIEYLSISKEKTYAEIRKKLWGKEADQIKINLEYRDNEKIKGNEIDAMLVGGSFFDKKKWLTLSEGQKDKVWSILKNYLDENIGREQVETDMSQFGLSFKKQDWPDKLKEPIGTCNYSTQALERIVPLMEKGANLYTAIEKAHFKKKHSQKSLLVLPDKSNGFQIPNPVVQTVMFQLRKVINLLIKENGLPDEIVIETARELKANKERRKEIVANQSENRNKKQNAINKIRESKGWSKEVDVSTTDVIKYLLWEEQKYYCPYACKKIELSELLSRDTEIDHILPYSMSLDNTMNNRVVCFSKHNQEKGQNTPISWLGADSPRWQAIQDAMNRNAFNFTDEKWERFSVYNDEIAEKYQPERLLRDTSYITREVRSYLKQLYSADKAEQKVRTSKGPITSELRNLWNLNAILRDGELGPKNRDDLRHHAVDAAVIAVTSHKKIQQITKTLQQNWPKRPKYAAIEEPWDGFGVQLAQAVERINISHRVQRKVKGALHKETNYWIEDSGTNCGKHITTEFLNGISQDTANKICDETIKKMVLARLKDFDGDSKKAFEEPLSMPLNPNKKRTKNSPKTNVSVYKVRVWNNLNTAFLVRDKKDEDKNKSFTNKVWVKPDDNHHLELFKIHKNGKIDYICKVWTVWDIAQRVKNKKPVILKQHPDYPDAEFVLSLSKQESVQILDKNGTMQNAHVLSISGQPDNFSKIDMEVRPLSVGDVRNLSDAEKKDLRKEWRITSLKDFDKRKIQKITVDPLGRVRRAGD